MSSAGSEPRESALLTALRALPERPDLIHLFSVFVSSCETVGAALTAPQSLALACCLEEPSTALQADIVQCGERCRYSQAALEAWGASSNLFHQGVAKQTEDPDIVAASMAKPGVVLKRPGSFAEHSDSPRKLVHEGAGSRRGKTRPKPKHQVAPKTGEKAARKAAADFGTEQKRREAEHGREEPALGKEHERQEKAVTKAQAAPDGATRRRPARSRQNARPLNSDSMTRRLGGSRKRQS
jgi:hypothetical protein